MRHLFCPLSRYVLAVTLCAMPVAYASDASSATSKEEKHTELELKMEDMGSAFKKLRRQVADPAQNASSLELVGKLVETAKASVELVPARLSDLPESERSAARAEYKKQMQQMIATLQQLETALKENKNPEAEELVKKLGAQQKQGHKEFKRPNS